MSTLLDEIIAARKEKAIEYEAYLLKIAELVKRVEAGQAEDTPAQLNTPGRRALYNNLRDNSSHGNVNTAADSGVMSADHALDLAVRIDAAVKHVRADGWRGVQARENMIKAALYGVLQNEAEVERIFLIIKQQKEY